MLDRSIAPPFREIEHVEITRAESKALSNGIPFHTIIAGTEPVVRLELIFKAGHWYEPANGISYFTTKLLSAGTSRLTSSQIEERIALYGAFLDIITGYDRATLVLYCLSKHLNQLAPLLMEMVNDSIYPEEEIQNLKKITGQNYKVNLKKTSFLASLKFRENLFGANHPYARTVDEATVNKVTKEDIIRYHSSHFTPQNLDIVLSGNGDEDFYSIINNVFGSGQWGNYQKTVSNTPTQSSADRTTLIEVKESVQSSIRMGKKLFSLSHPDYFKVSLLIEILGGYFGSRLMKNIREEKGYTYGINSSFHSLNNAGYLVIGTDVNKENTENTIGEIYKEIQILQNELIDINELTTVRNYLMGSFVSSLSTPFGLADRFKTIYFQNLNYSFFDAYMKSLESITPFELREVANQYLAKDSFLEVVAGGR